MGMLVQQCTIERDEATGILIPEFIGVPTEIGTCLYGTTLGIVDYSRKERDEFGDMILIERGYSDLVGFKVEVLTENVKVVRDLLASLRATTAVYLNQEPSLTISVIGYLTQFSITLDDWKTSSLSLEVESIVQY